MIFEFFGLIFFIGDLECYPRILLVGTQTLGAETDRRCILEVVFVDLLALGWSLCVWLLTVL